MQPIKTWNYVCVAFHRSFSIDQVNFGLYREIYAFSVINPMVSERRESVRFTEKLILNFSIAAPSQAPTSFSVAALSSTSIVASWQLPPINGRNGIITGYKLYYKKKHSAGSFTVLRINDIAILTKDVTGLEKYTEYELKVLAFTSVGDGPTSAVKFMKTMEDGKRLGYHFLEILSLMFFLEDLNI